MDERVEIPEDGIVLFIEVGETNMAFRACDRTECASVLMEGRIKWDGCIDVDFGQYQHFCSRDMAGKIGRLLDRIYDLGAGKIPDADPECFL